MNVKPCYKCKIEKPVNEFYSTTNNVDGLQSYCKSCTLTITKARRRKLKSRASISLRLEQVCSSCNILKVSTDFYKNSCNPGGLEYRCKVCTGIRFRTKASYKAQKEAEDKLKELSWKPIPSTGDAYSASECGQICSNQRSTIRKSGRIYTTHKRILKLNPDSNGYLQFTARFDGTKKTYLVHRAVYEAWKGAVAREEDIDHKDENILNNHIDNLQSVSRLHHTKLTKERIFDKIREEAYRQGVEDGLKKARLV